jgi:hypothetical protein
MTDAAAPPPDEPEQSGLERTTSGPVPEHVPAESPVARTASDPQEKDLVGRFFEHVPHPRYEHHRLSGPVSTETVAAEVHGGGFFGRINSRVGLRVTLVVGTMWAAYLFFGLALYGLPQAIKNGPGQIVLWTSSEFLQLVLLPIIIVGQNIQAKASDARAEDTYKDAEAIMHECVQLQKHLHAQDQVLMETIDHVRQLASTLSGAAPPAAGGSATS